MDANRVEERIRALQELDLENLQIQWRMHFGRTAPKNLSKKLLFRFFAYRLQADRDGDLEVETLQFLGSVNSDAKVKLPERGGAWHGRLSPGTILVREHGGIDHHVMVTGKGFSWNGAEYQSLSQVARAITGTNWNGPRFFGLKQVRNEQT